MLVLSMLCHAFYDNYNIILLFYEVRPEAYLRVRGIKDFLLRVLSSSLNFFSAMPRKLRNSTDY